MSLQNEDTVWLVRLLQKPQFLQQRGQRGGTSTKASEFQSRVSTSEPNVGQARTSAFHQYYWISSGALS
jgi:hypothetical protein